MSRKRPSGYALLLAVLILALATGMLYAAATTSNLDWWFLGGSGGRSGSGGHVLEGTLGQPVVGLATGDDNSLCAGFGCGAQGTYSLYLPVIVKGKTAGQQTITKENVTQVSLEIRHEFSQSRIKPWLHPHSLSLVVASQIAAAHTGLGLASADIKHIVALVRIILGQAAATVPENPSPRRQRRQVPNLSLYLRLRQTPGVALFPVMTAKPAARPLSCLPGRPDAGPRGSG
jgi:hypothetical protein